MIDKKEQQLEWLIRNIKLFNIVTIALGNKESNSITIKEYVDDNSNIIISAHCRYYKLYDLYFLRTHNNSYKLIKTVTYLNNEWYLGFYHTLRSIVKGFWHKGKIIDINTTLLLDTYDATIKELERCELANFYNRKKVIALFKDVYKQNFEI